MTGRAVSDSREYALDSNVFVEAKRRYYAFDICPGFWKNLLWHQGRGRVSSVDRIKEELDRGGDDLTKWINSVMPEACFAATDDADVIRFFGEMVTWVNAQPQFLQEAKAEFAAGADGWLIAYAKAKDLVLVTQEIALPEARRRVPIPNVCEAFDVAYVDTFDMLRDFETRFSWQPSA
jgi:Domain of unknown function (DUF4411)